jgi:hypothetical protein
MSESPDHSDDESESGERFLMSLAALRAQATDARVPSGVLQDDPLSLCATRAQDGLPERAALDQVRWEQLYFDLQRGGKKALPPLDAVSEAAERAAATGITPIAVADIAYEHPRERLVRVVLAARRRDGAIPALANPDAELSSGRAFFASALTATRRDFGFGTLPHEHAGLEVTFGIPTELFVTNISKDPPSEVAVDAGDGAGVREVNLDEAFTVRYDLPGEKTVRLAVERDGERLEAAFRITVTPAVKIPRPDATWPLTATIPYRGVLGTGTAYVLYGSARGRKHTRLVAPVILADGFPGHTFAEMYTTMDHNGFLQTLLQNGLDAVFLTYGNGTDYVQRNAYVVVAAVQRVVRERQGNRPLTVAGASMGGVLTRYALAYMEQEHLDHQTDRWLSLDAPHHGAELPPAVQHVLLQLAGSNNTAKQKAALVTSAAARQMLYSSVAKAGEVQALPAAEHVEFYRELRGLNGTGYPKLPYKIAVSNGAGDGKRTIPDGAHTLHWDASFYGADAWALPTGAGTVDRVWTSTGSGRCTIADAIAYDGAPGGQRASNGELAQALIDNGKGTVQHWYDRHCFVPTVSALDLPDPNPYQTVPGTGAKTPFDDYFVSSRNRDHVELTSEICAYLYGVLGVVPHVAAYGFGVGLAVQDAGPAGDWQTVAAPKATSFSLDNGRLAWTTAEGNLFAHEGPLSGPAVALQPGKPFLRTKVTGSRVFGMRVDSSFGGLEGPLDSTGWHWLWPPGSVHLFDADADRIVLVRTVEGGRIWGAEGAVAGADFRTIGNFPGEEVADLQVTGERVGVLFRSGTLHVNEGGLNAPWTLSRPRTKQFLLRDNRVAAVDADGTLWVTQGPLSTPAWRQLWLRSTGLLAMDDDRIGITATTYPSPAAQLWVREGPVDEDLPWFNQTVSAAGVDSLSMDTTQIAVALTDGTVHLKAGPLTNAWISQPKIAGRSIVKVGRGSVRVY